MRTAADLAGFLSASAKWLRYGIGVTAWGQRPLSPRDLAAFRRFVRKYNIRLVRLLALCVAGFNLAFWPTDLFVFRGQPEILRIYVVGRSIILVLVIALYFLVDLPALRRVPEVPASVLTAAL